MPRKRVARTKGSTGQLVKRGTLRKAHPAGSATPANLSRDWPGRRVVRSVRGEWVEVM
jgi:hypothetical protein